MTVLEDYRVHSSSSMVFDTQAASSSSVIDVDMDSLDDNSRCGVDKKRQKRLQEGYNKFLWLLRFFGVLRVPHRSGTQEQPSTTVCGIIKLSIFVSAILLFNAQLSYLFIKATAHLQSVTIVQIHFLSRSQFSVVTAAGMVIVALRNKKLPMVLSAIIRACCWANDADWYIARGFLCLSWVYLIFLLGGLYPIGIIIKILAVRNLTDSLFGLSVPAEFVSACMITIQTVGISFRVVHLNVVIVTCGALAVQYRRLTADMKQIGLSSQNFVKTGEMAPRMVTLLRRHYELSQLVRELDIIFAPSLFIFTASDLVVITSLISYFISAGQLEAPLGHYFTQNGVDMAVYTNYVVGAIFVLITRIATTAYLSDKAHSCVPVLHKVLQKPNLKKGLKKDIKATLERLRDVPVGLTGWGLFLFNRQFILTVLGLLATYLVVVVEISTNNDCRSDHSKALRLVAMSEANASALSAGLNTIY